MDAISSANPVHDLLDNEEPEFVDTREELQSLELPDDDSPELQVIGPIRLVGVPEDLPLSPVALEMLAYLIFHPDQLFNAETLASGLGRGRKQDHSPPTMRRYANDLRRVVGAARFPKARRRGYGKIEVSSDVERFDELVRQSTTITDTAEQIRLLKSAVTLVRGVPFADRADGSYGWAYTDEDFASLLTNRILAAAARLAEIALSLGDTEIATYAVRKGLLVRSTDIALLQLGLRAAAASTPSRLSQAWDEMGRRFKAEDERIPEILHETYRGLQSQVADR